VTRADRLRKQYHFWPGPEGLNAWDVDRLIELSRDLPIEQVTVESIWEVDTNYWFDSDEPQPSVRDVVAHAELIRDVDLAYPIILGVDGRVMDGMHRVAKALLEGRQTIPVVRFVEELEPDFRNCRPQDLPYD
jgi:hypothetical protein